MASNGGKGRQDSMTAWRFSKQYVPPMRNPSQTNNMHGNRSQKVNPNGKAVENISTSIYITNIPWSATTKDIWNRCQQWDKVIDVYISLKKSKVGARFGFVRFLNVPNVTRLIENLRTIWMGNFHLFADTVKFPRKDSSNRSASNNDNNQKSRTNGSPFGEGRSFAEVLSGKVAGEKKSLIVKKTVKLVDEDCIDMTKTGNSILVKVREIQAIHKVHSMIKADGFDDFMLRYVGGKWLWVELSSKSIMINFCNSLAMKDIFVEFKTLGNGFVLDERLIWIDVLGMPLEAWTPRAFKAVAAIWGEPTFVDMDGEESMAHGKVCILTKFMDKIAEKIMVEVNDEVYDVKVTEFAYWAPSFDVDNETSSEVVSSSASDFVGPEIDDTSSTDSKREDGLHSSDKVEEHDDPFALMDLIERIQDDELIGNDRINDSQKPSQVESSQPVIENSTTAFGEREVTNFEAGENSEKPVASLEMDDSPSDPSKPPGFENAKQHEPSIEEVHEAKENNSNDSTGHSVNNAVRSKDQSLINNMERHIQMGKAMGLDMSGAMTDLDALTARMSGKVVDQ